MGGVSSDGQFPFVSGVPAPLPLVARWIKTDASGAGVLHARANEGGCLSSVFKFSSYQG